MELRLLFLAQLVSVLEQFDQLLLCQLDVRARRLSLLVGAAVHLLMMLLHLVAAVHGHDWLPIHIDIVHLLLLVLQVDFLFLNIFLIILLLQLLLLLLHLLHLLLVDQELLLLLGGELLEEFLLLFGVETLEGLDKLHGLLLQLRLLLHSRGALLDARVDDVLALAFLLLRRYLVDDLLLLVLVGFLLGEQGRLLGCELIFSSLLLSRVMTTAFESWEEIV